MTANADHEGETFPTARDPWTATLCWARGQNSSMVSVFPNRTPVHAIIGRLLGGESFSEVAVDFDVPVETVRVLWQLRKDFADADLLPAS